MNDQIMKHFEMKLLWENKRIMNEKGDIIDVYIQPERTSEKDHSEAIVEGVNQWLNDMRCSEHSNERE